MVDRPSSQSDSDPHPSDLLDTSLVDRYLRGECTSAEAAQVDAWIAANGAKGESLRLLLLRTRLPAEWTSPEAMDAFRARFREQISVTRSGVPGTGEAATGTAPPYVGSTGVSGRGLGAHPPRGRLFLGGMTAARARAVWVCGVAAVLVLTIGRWSHLALQSRASTLAHTTYTTTVGQVARLTLADGSHVTLAPRSRLTIAEHFGSATRDVTLVGEAYFVVQSALRAPFVVHTGPVSTRVLGTVFDVRRYADDRTTHVSVVSGRVATGGRVTSAVLVAGSIGQVTDSTVVVNPADDPSTAVAWTQGRLVFNDTPVPVLLATLGRWYGYEFRLTDTALAASHVSMAFKTDEPIETMNVVKALLGVTMTFDGNVVVLRPKQASASISQPKSARELLKNPKPEVGR